jgi:hypothetical protein
MLGLDFILTPHNHEQAVHMHVMTYSKYGKEIFHNVVNTLHIRVWAPPDCKSHTKSQRQLKKVLKSNKLKKLLKDHYIIEIDKNMGITIVLLTWKVMQYWTVLYNEHNYRVILNESSVFNDTLLDCILFMVDLRGKITQWLTTHLSCLSRHIKLDGMELLPGFYMISKVHKTPVMNHPICNVHFSVTSLAFLLTLRILILIYGKLKRVLSNKLL